MRNRRLTSLERSFKVATAHLALTGDDREDTEADWIAESREDRRQRLRVVLAQDDAGRRRAARCALFFDTIGHKASSSLTCSTAEGTLYIDRYRYKVVTMSRLQLALNVSNLDEAISFYSRLFSVAPAKVRPGYANFALTDPPLKLVLIEGAGEGGSINHLGIEVHDADAVRAAAEHLSGQGMATDIELATTCCYAEQDKVWVVGPDGAHWEIYTVLNDVGGVDALGGDDRCCTPDQAIVTLRDVPAPSTSCC
jgi:lactoylglutathione lyase